VFYVRHDHVNGLVAAEWGEAVRSEQDLPAGHRLLDASSDLAGLVSALGCNGLFIPRQAIRFESRRNADRERHVEETVTVHHQIDIGSDCVTHGRHGGDAILDGGFDR
jgi:hypothetical protein